MVTVLELVTGQAVAIVPVRAIGRVLVTDRVGETDQELATVRAAAIDRELVIVRVSATDQAAATDLESATDPVAEIVLEVVIDLELATGRAAEINLEVETDLMEEIGPVSATDRASAIDQLATGRHQTGLPIGQTDRVARLTVAGATAAGSVGTTHGTAAGIAAGGT